MVVIADQQRRRAAENAARAAPAQNAKRARSAKIHEIIGPLAKTWLARPAHCKQQSDLATARGIFAKVNAALLCAGLPEYAEPEDIARHLRKMRAARSGRGAATPDD